MAVLYGYIEELEIETGTLQPSTPVGVNAGHEASKKVFIVHGHDGELKEATARLGLEPVILSPSFATRVVQGPPKLINTRPLSKGLHYKRV